MLPAYAELFAFSNFTFLHGASRGEELVARAAQLGYAGLAITDECSLAGVVRAHVEAKSLNFPLVIGSYFKLVNADLSPAFGLILLATNRNGYGNLSELITIARMRSKKGAYLLTPNDLARPDKEFAHLRGMPDCLAILVPDFPAIPAKQAALDAQIEWLDSTFPQRAWVGLTLHQRALDDMHRGTIEHVAAFHKVPVVATGNVVMISRRTPNNICAPGCGSRISIRNTHLAKRSTCSRAARFHSMICVTTIRTRSCRPVIPTRLICGRKLILARTGVFRSAFRTRCRRR